jgi:hypothetical protein
LVTEGGGVGVEPTPHIYRFSSSSKYIGRWGEWGRDRLLKWGIVGTESGQTAAIAEDIAADAHGNVYVPVNDHVLKFDPHGRVIRRWGPFRAFLGSIAIAPTGEIYLEGSLLSDAPWAILKVSKEGRLLAEWKMQ